MASTKKGALEEQGGSDQGSIKDHEKTSIPDILKQLATSVKGLSTEEAKARQ